MECTTESAEAIKPMVLVIEDDAALRSMLEDLLRLENYAVAGARDGADAVRLIAGGLRPALIVLDLMMPVMDGWEFERVLRQELRLSTPLIVVTAGGYETMVTAPVASGYVFKPMRMRELLETINRALGAHDAPSGAKTR